MLFPMLPLALYEVYKLLTIGIRWQGVLLDALVVMGSSFALVQFSFAITFRLHDCGVRQQERLAILHQVDTDLGASLDQEQVVKVVLESVLSLIPAQGARVFTYDPERQEFIAGWECLASGECCSIDHRPRPSGFNARVAQTGEHLVVEDAAGVPLLHGGRVLGTLSVSFDVPYTFAAGELEALRLLGSRAAAALENTRLFLNAVREREVAHTLLDTARALSTTLRLDRLLDRVLDELQRVVPYDAASINLLHDEYCWPVASRGVGYIPLQRFVLEEFPLAQQVVHERGPVIVPNMQDEAGVFPAEADGLAHAWLGVPLISKNEVTGVLMVDYHDPDAYDEETARLVSAFAHQVALAIDNSRLYEQTRAQLHEATLLHGVITALSSTLDVGQLLPYVAHSLCEILRKLKRSRSSLIMWLPRRSSWGGPRAWAGPARWPTRLL